MTPAPVPDDPRVRAALDVLAEAVAEMVLAELEREADAQEEGAA